MCIYFASATSNKCCNNLILRCGAASTAMNECVTFVVLCWIITILVCCKLVWSPGLYGLKFGNLIACRSFLHLNSYNLVGSVTLRKYASTYILPFLSPEPPKNILLLIWERIAKNISVFPCEINAQAILVTATCYVISGDECSKKREKIWWNKKGQVPRTLKERKKWDER